MSKKGHPALIGLFVIGAAALALAGLMLFGGGGLWREKQVNVLYFSGSVKGLSVGSPVMLRGVTIGQVKDIRVLCDLHDLSFRIPVIIETDPDLILTVDQGREQSVGRRGTVPREFIDKLISRGLRGQLQLQSLVTGQLFVQLDLFPKAPLRLVGTAGAYQEIPTIPSSFEEVSKTLEQIPLDQLVQKVMRTLSGIESLVNNPDLAASLGAAREALVGVRDLTGRVDARLAELVTSVGSTMEEVKILARDLDGQVHPLGTSLLQAAGAARRAFERTDAALATLEGTVADGSVERRELRRALKEVAEAARAVRILAEELDMQPDLLLKGRQGGEP